MAQRLSLGPASLVVVPASGVPRTIPLPSIEAGSVHVDGDPGASRDRFPGLAVDPGGERAWVLAADGGSVAEVDLASGGVVLHALPGAGPTGTAQRAQRTAVWLPNGTLAITGNDEGYFGRRRYGLRLLDLASWQLRTVDPSAESVLASTAALVVAGARGVRVYDLAGRLRFRRLGGSAIVRLSLSGHRLFASAQRPRHRTFVLDLRSGRTVATLPTAQPALLLDAP